MAVTTLVPVVVFLTNNSISTIIPETKVNYNLQFSSHNIDGPPNTLYINSTNLGNESLDTPRRGFQAGPGENMTLKVITLVLYLATFVVGLLGNALVIYVIVRFTSIRTKSVANYYILNLAIADVVFILTVPLFCYATFTENWVFGNPLCKILYVFKEINKFGSIFTLTALSVDRFLASFHELSFLRTIKAGKFVCLGVWMASMTMCMPYFLYSYSTETFNRNDTYVCRISWPQSNTLYHRRLWTYSQVTIGLVIPLVVIMTSYLMLMQRLKGIMALRQTHRAKRPNNKLTRTIIIVVITFVICQVPYYVIDIISLHKVELSVRYLSRGEVYRPSRTELMAFFYCNALAQMLVFISCCCNPIIYGITNDNFCKYISLCGFN